jgi:hypothetical protein
VTGGNPFFVTEVLAAGGSQLPTSVRDAVLARTARLSPRGRGVVDVASLAGPRAELDLLETLLGAHLAAIDEPRGAARGPPGAARLRVLPHGSELRGSDRAGRGAEDPGPAG